MPPPLYPGEYIPNTLTPGDLQGQPSGQGVLFPGQYVPNTLTPGNLQGQPTPGSATAPQAGAGSSCGGILNLPPSLCQGATYKHVGLIIAGALLILIGVGGVAFDKTVSQAKVLPI